jgi:hypothetical protein
VLSSSKGNASVTQAPTMAGSLSSSSSLHDTSDKLENITKRVIITLKNVFIMIDILKEFCAFLYRNGRCKDREIIPKKQEKPYAKITQMNARPLRRV